MAVFKTFPKGSVIGSGDYVFRHYGEEGVPSIYQRCEWIGASSGNGAYIDLGFPFVEGGTAEIGFIKEGSSETDIQIFGAAENSGKLRFMLSAGVSWYATRGNAFFNIDNFTDDWKNYIGAEIKLRCAYKNGVVKSEILSPTSKTHIYDYPPFDTITMTRNLYLLGQNYNTGYRGTGLKKVTYFKYWDKNDVLVRDMLPYYRKTDGVIGMYNLASKQFFTNAGTGSFTKGADVND